jgi:DNA-binding MarR family transcriptional regulator
VAPRRLTERQSGAWRTFIAVQQHLTAELERRLLRDGGLTGAEFTLLVPLSEAPDGMIRARDLGRAVGWERSRVSHQVARMVKRGLLAREDCADDARGLMVKITDAGRRAIEAVAPAHAEAVLELVFDALDDADVQALDTALSRVLARLPR